MSLLNERPELWVSIAALVLALLLILFSLLRGRRRYPYEAVDALYSPAELRFFRAMEKALDGQNRLYAKVRLADLLRVRSGLSGKHYFRAFNAIACKHVDYVICDAASHRVLCVIELDDRSHDRRARRARDEFVDAAFAAAGIPILHFPVRGRYPVNELRARLREALP